jgi:chemotaxis signal transduction protein
MDMAVIDINAETSPFVLFSVSDVVYGISSSHVLSIEILSTPTPLVNAPRYTLGVLDFRGDMIPLIGMRQLFNQDARGEGLRGFMQNMRSDYEDWVNSFEEAVNDGRGSDVNFKDDNCKLGVWLSDFDTQNNSLSIHVNRITKVHASVNRRGKKIAQTAKTDKEKALTELEELKNTYINELLGLIDACADAYLEGIREMLLVLNVGEMTKGIVVDEIVSVEYINQFLDMPANSNKSKYVRSLARRDKDNSTVLLIDEELIIEL